MNQGKVKLQCVTDDRDHLLTVGKTYELTDYYYCGNEVICECDHGYVKWFSCKCFGYDTIDDLLRDTNERND